MLIEGINGIGQVVITLIQTSIQSLGMIVILGMLAIVEIDGIKSGLWFLEHPSIATLSAIALVAYNMVIDTMIVNVEHEEKYERPPRNVASLRLFYNSLAYRIGFSSTWEPMQKSPAQTFYEQRRLITFTVFLLALSGRIQPLIISLSDVPFEEGVMLFFTQASLQDVFVWVSGITLTMASLFGVQRLTHYTAQQVIIIKAEQKQTMTNRKRNNTRRRNQTRQPHALTRLSDTSTNDSRATDVTRGKQALSYPDALNLLRRNIHIITPRKSAPAICDELDIEAKALRTVQRALKEMRDNNEIE